MGLPPLLPHRAIGQPVARERVPGTRGQIRTLPNTTWDSEVGTRTGTNMATAPPN